MKNSSIKKFCLICRFLCAPFLISAQGNVFNYADSICQEKNYPLAAVEYERVIFEASDPAIKAQGALKRAYCQKLMKRYRDAASTLEAVNLFALSDSLRYGILFQSILYSYLAHDPNLSFSKLETLSHFYPDSANNRDLLLMKIVSLNELRQWGKADTVYRQFMATYTRDTAGIPNPYLRIPKLKNPEKAEKLSAYLPFTGAGLFYAGDVKEGLLNLVVQIGFVGFGAYSILMERYITGVLIGVGGYAAFYNGGVRRAKRLAVEYNNRKTLEFNAAVRAQLFGNIRKGDRLSK